ncbi:SAM-dependent methyltransferase [Streptomyces sp. NPDC088197]|uniref:SAM-dependent methyltransferase n=1 Tax=unclassified Streptomyces TaxID=2593676 RepID=UPI0033AC3648
MASTLYRGTRSDAESRARDWAEIQERMLVPLYESVYDRLEVGADTRLLGLGCGAGLALLLAADRGAAVTGFETDEQRLALARERLLPAHPWGGPARARGRTRLTAGVPHRLTGGFDLVTAFDPAAPAAELLPSLCAAAATADPDTAIVLAGWGPPERCATSRVLRVATRLAEPRGPAAREVRLSGRDDLENLALAAGLRPDGSGRVSCPFGYPDLPSAVRGLLSTGLFDAAVEATDRQQVDKEIAEALHPYRRPDGSVRMENVFRYLIVRTPDAGDPGGDRPGGQAARRRA